MCGAITLFVLTQKKKCETCHEKIQWQSTIFVTYFTKYLLLIFSILEVYTLYIQLSNFGLVLMCVQCTYTCAELSK